MIWEKSRAVAVVGMGVRFPSTIATLDALWRVLLEGMDQVREVPSDRWVATSFYHPNKEAVWSSVSKWGSFLDGIAEFDVTPFGLSVREARWMDPQQRLALEVSYEAIEDAGLPVDALQGRHVGVFFGVSTWDYAMHQFSPFSINNLDAYSATGMALSIVANRVSYCLNLKGPSLICDTACSSSLMSIHLAVRSLLAGDCEMAIAGGVNVILNPGNSIAFSKMGILSPSGRCRTFSGEADGFVRGEGAGAVLIMPLDMAQTRGLPIYATIIATQTNQDGATNGLAVPNGESQRILLESIYHPTGVPPEHLGYVEAHGTGTPVGDAVEAHSIGAIALKRSRSVPPLWVGSVKTNFGHLEAASGILGFIKAVLVCYHGVIPPNLHFNRPSPHINFDALNIAVPKKPEPLSAGTVVGVNSFGFGGTNVHVTLLASDLVSRPIDSAMRAGAKSPAVIALSADTPQHLASAVDHLLETTLHFETRGGQPPLSMEEIAGALVHHRSALRFRRTLVADSIDQIRDKLKSYCGEDGRSDPARIVQGNVANADVKVAFVFTGQGSQWIGMGSELCAWSPIFNQTFKKCCHVCLEETGLDLLYEINTQEAQSGVVVHPEIAQPMMVAFQISLVALWQAFGVFPFAVIGHSVGELAAAWAAGVFGIEDAMRMACRRGMLVEKYGQAGQMLVIAASTEQVKPLLRAGSSLCVSAYNAPRQLSIGGTIEEIQKLKVILRREHIAFKSTSLPFAFHTALMDPCAPHFPGVMKGLRMNAPELPFFSTVPVDSAHTVARNIGDDESPPCGSYINFTR